MANVRISKSLGVPDVERCIRPDGSVDGKALRDVLRFFLREADMNRRETYNDMQGVNTQVVYLDEIVQSVTVTGEGGTTYIKGGSIETNSVEADIFDADYVYTKNLHIGDIVVDESGNYISGSGLYADTSGNVVIGGLSGGDGVQTYYQSAAPSSPNAGDLWYDTDDWSMRRYNGSTWKLVSDVTGQNTAANTANVGAVASSTIAGWVHSEDTTKINGGTIFTGSIMATAIESNFTWSKNFIMSTDGKIYTSGKSYGAGTNGIFLGYDDSKYKFDITNGNYYFRYDGSNAPEIKTNVGILGDDDNYFSITDRKLVLSYAVTAHAVYGDYVARTYISPAYATFYVNGAGESVDWWGKMDLGYNGITFSRYADPSTGVTYLSQQTGAGKAFIGLDDSSGTFCIKGVDAGGGVVGKNFYIDNVHLINTCIMALSSIVFDITEGGILYAGDSHAECTSAGSALQVLQSSGTSAPVWSGRAVTLIGRVQSRSTSGSCTVDQFVGSGVTCDRTSSTDGQYALYLGTGNWIVYLSTGPVANTLGGNGMVVNPIMNSSGYFANSSTVANVEIQSVGNVNVDQDFHYIAFKIS